MLTLLIAVYDRPCMKLERKRGE